MAVDAESLLVGVLESFLSYVKETDLITAKVNCEIIESLLHNADGSPRIQDFEIKDSNGCAVEISVPAISITAPPLLYTSEVSFEITGSEVLRTYGMPLSIEKTENLSPIGQEFRKKIEDYGYNTTIQITDEDKETHLKFTIIKDGTSMTKYMESWLENPTKDNLKHFKTTLLSDN